METITVNAEVFTCRRETANLVKFLLSLDKRGYFGTTTTKWHNGEPTITERLDKIKHGEKDD